MCLTASTSSLLQTTSLSAHALRCVLLVSTVCHGVGGVVRRGWGEVWISLPRRAYCMSHPLRRSHACGGWWCLHKHHPPPPSPPTTKPRPQYNDTTSTLKSRCGSQFCGCIRGVTALRHSVHSVTCLNTDWHPFVGILASRT